jgi:CxxC motif-containing protein (DUF1111 family)
MTRRAASLGAKLGCVGFCVAVPIAIWGGRSRADVTPEKKPDAAALGYEIFNREWMPNDPRGHGGDGLGPVYNDSSCVACHNSGGSGGAGPVSKNIDILSASRNLAVVAQMANTPGRVEGQPGTFANGATVAPSASPSIAPLTDMHAGFKAGRNVVLHKFGTDPNFESWRNHVLNPTTAQGAAVASSAKFIVTTKEVPVLVGAVKELGDVQEERAVLRAFDAKQTASKRRRASAPDRADSGAMIRIQEIQAMVAAANPGLKSSPRAVGEFLVARSQRNPTPLFGIGSIDAIPEDAIEANAKRQAKETPETQGRVSRLKDGRIGRLGWKGQVATVEDFVLNACAVELGLEVPGHHQAIVPQAPKYQATGLDLTSEECRALVSYVKSLPKPLERTASGVAETKIYEAGKARFASIGCAGCHSPKLGNVQGIYSDLLLHDMGQEMSDDGSYVESSGDDEPLVPRIVADASNGRQGQPAIAQPPRGATRQEWRTPPLWGFRDSGPYLHDGRAQTLEQAVAMHGGQGAASARKFFELSPRERLEIEALLKSLIAPPTGALASR